MIAIATTTLTPLLAGLLAQGGDPVATLDWKALGVEKVAKLDGDVVSVTNDELEKKTVTLATLEPPPVKATRWIVRGQVRHRDVEGQAYLETWNTVEGSEYFSRTLAPGGPMRALTGSAEWRAFALPFDASSSGSLPTKIVFNVVLPGKGTVEIRKVEVVSMVHADAGWLDGAQVGVLIGLLGAVFGVLAGLMGSLAGQGKARQGVTALWSLLIAGSVIVLAFGMAAAATRQPAHITVSMLGFALLGLVILIPLKRTITKRYEAFEQGKMPSTDGSL